MAARPPLPENRSLDFGFAFNDVTFSDRILRIEISCHDLAERSDEQIFDSSMLDFKDGLTYEIKEEAAAMIEESSGGAEVTVNEPSHEVAKDNESSSSMECSGVQVRVLHVSSPILAADSPFFYKLFSNGMKESQQRQVTLQIQASEEDALMDLLNFMYRNTLPRITPTALLNVLLAADKFEVASCMKYCSRLLQTLKMTCESALLYLGLPTTVLMPDVVQQLRDAARKFLVNHFKDLTKHEEEFLKLPLAGFEAVLSSDDLQVSCEDDVYELVLKWAQLHYPKLEERREMLSKRILQFVRFPWMSFWHLKKVQTCGEIESEVAYKVVSDALLFKVECPHRQRSLANAHASFRQFVERPYINKPVKVVQLGLPHHKFIVYMNLKREECARLYHSGQINSQAFYLREKRLFLYGRCMHHERNWTHYFELLLGIDGKAKKAGLLVDYDVAAIMKPSEDFESMNKGKDFSFFGFNVISSRPWDHFMATNSPYFINDVLHLKVELTIRN